MYKFVKTDRFKEIRYGDSGYHSSMSGLRKSRFH